MTFTIKYEQAEEIKISGVESKEELSRKLCEAWIPYVECHKCGMAKNCSFAHPPSPRTGKRREIKCGMSKAVLENWLSAIWVKYQAADENGKKEILSSAFYLSKIGYLIPWVFGNCLNYEFIEVWKDNAPGVFRSLVSLRENLDVLALHLGRVDIGLRKIGVHFVEGETESLFLDNLFRFQGRFDEKLLVYGGRSNRRVQRIEIALRDYRDRGYEIYISGDADNLPGGNPFQQLVDRCLVQVDKSFYFTKDFESAFPAGAFNLGLKELGLDIQMDDVTERGYESRKKYLLACHGFDLDEIKMDLADVLSRIVRNNWSAFFSDDGEFSDSEISKFLKFSLYIP